MIAIIGLGGAFSIFLAIIKLAGVFTWPWWVVAMPYCAAMLYLLQDIVRYRCRQRQQYTAWRRSLYEQD